MRDNKSNTLTLRSLMMPTRANLSIVDWVMAEKNKRYDYIKGTLICVDVVSSVIQIEGRQIRFQRWFLDGRRQFHTIHQNYIKQLNEAGQSCVAFFDMQDSPDGLFSLIETLDMMGKEVHSDFPRFLLINFREEKRAEYNAQKNELLALAKSRGIAYFIESSMQAFQNVELVEFVTLYASLVYLGHATLTHDAVLTEITYDGPVILHAADDSCLATYPSYDAFQEDQFSVCFQLPELEPVPSVVTQQTKPSLVNRFFSFFSSSNSENKSQSIESKPKGNTTVAGSMATAPNPEAMQESVRVVVPEIQNKMEERYDNIFSL